MSRAGMVASGLVVALVVACNSVLGIPEVERLPADGGASATPTNGACAANEKSCGGRCVDVGSPVTGCGAVSCEPCKIANGTAACVNGACAVATCSPSFGDCNSLPDDGCERKIDEQNNCLGCDLKCRVGFVCGTDGCECSTLTSCGAGGVCQGGKCTCGAEECFVGWFCAPNGGGCTPL